MQSSFAGYGGVILNIGDKVELVSLEGSYNINTRPGVFGTIVGTKVSATRPSEGQVLVGVDWDIENHDFHNCDGKARPRHGWWLMPQCLVSRANSKSHLDAQLGNLTEALSKIDQYVVLNGHVFELKDTLLADPTMLLQNRDKAVIQTVQHKIQELKVLEKAMENRYNQALIMPNITIDDLPKGIMCYTDGVQIHICKRVVYQPKYMLRGLNHRIIPEDESKSLKQDWVADVTLPDFTIIMRDPLTMVERSHYHSLGGHDCIGTLDPSTFWDKKKETLISSVMKFIDAVMELFKTINMDDLAHEHPFGMRPAKDLWRDSETTDVVDEVLVASKLPYDSGYDDDDEDRDGEDQDEEPPEPRFGIGDHVVISRTSIYATSGAPRGTIGVICGEADNYDYDSGWEYGVKFEKEHPSMSHCNHLCPDHHGLWIHETYLEHAPALVAEPVSISTSFIAGDRIEITRNTDGAKIGELGTVIDHKDGTLTVEFDIMYGDHLHECSGRVLSGRGLWVDNTCVRRFPPPMQIGETVLAIDNYDHVVIGDIGIICEINTNSRNSRHPIGVRWHRESTWFHDCEHQCTNNHGYYVPNRIVVRIDPIQEFDIGDKVIVSAHQGTALIGDTGIIRAFSDSDQPNIAVEFEREGFHDCNGACSNDHGYYMDPHNIHRLINTPLITSLASTLTPRVQEPVILEEGVLSI